MVAIVIQLIGAFFGNTGLLRSAEYSEEALDLFVFCGNGGMGNVSGGGKFHRGSGYAEFSCRAYRGGSLSDTGKIFSRAGHSFLIPGIFPMVPGAGMYEIAYNAVRGDQGLVNYYIMQTLQIAGAIAVGIFLADIVQRVIMPKSIQKKLTKI